MYAIINAKNGNWLQVAARRVGKSRWASMWAKTVAAIWPNTIAVAAEYQTKRTPTIPMST